MEKHTVLCFEIEEQTPGRWKVKNLLTGVEHTTYGTQAEVLEQAEVQGKAWERKTSAVDKNKGQRGSAWRTRNFKNEAGAGKT